MRFASETGRLQYLRSPRPASTVLLDNEGMSELIGPRPVFTIVMGCNGVGKSAWKPKHYDLLSTRYFDQDSIAGGIGDWNSPDHPYPTDHTAIAGDSATPTRAGPQ